ncbi:MAG TPA: hypothetical protein VH744_05745, partial [Terriglobales bacterium]
QFLAAAVSLSLTAIPLAAQQGGVPVDQVHVGSSLVALNVVPVRDHAPGGGVFYAKGEQTGALQPRESVTVSREQTVSTVLGNQKWVYFSREKLSPASGWVLVGNAGTTSANFGAKH